MADEELKVYSWDDLQNMKFEDDEFTPVNILKNGPWYIQNDRRDKNAWELSNSDKVDDCDYAFELKSEHDVIRALAHISEKTWVDRLALLNGLMPAIVFFDHGDK